jgi:hypothetical protein
MAVIKTYNGGENRERPVVLGAPNGSKAVFVEATGLYEGLLVRSQAWVTGDKVQPGIARGSLVPLGVPLDTLVTPKKTVNVMPGNEGVREQDAAALHEKIQPAADDTKVEPLEHASEVLAPDVIVVIDDPEPEPVESSYDPGEYPVSKVIEYIEDHPDEASVIIEAEKAGRNRKTLLREFED